MKKVKLMFFIVVLGLLGPITANATLIEVEIDGQVSTYDVSLSQGVFSSQIDILEEQIWWGNEAIAKLFANEYSDTSGSPNVFWGPFFTFGLSDRGFLNITLFSNGTVDTLGVDLRGNLGSFPFFFATASRVDVSEPPIVAVLLLGFWVIAARRKKRQS